VVTGCSGSNILSFFEPESTEQPYTPSDWRNVKSHYKAYLHGRLGTQWNLSHYDPHGIFKGSATLTKLTGGGAAGRLLKSLGTVSTVGRITGAYGANGLATSLTVSGLGLIGGPGATGSLCVSFSAHAVSGYADQLFLGTFRVAGGTGRAAHLHGSGTFVILQPNQLKSYNSPFVMELAVGFMHALIGRSQRLTVACRNATKPSGLPPPKKLTATFIGWAFAPGGAKTTALPPGTTIYSDAATVNGAVGCGGSDNLYGVVDYSGANNATLSGFVLNKFQQTLNQGRNVVFFGAGPPNGPLSSKGTVDARGYQAVDFTHSLTLNRTC
jgi:hypothetical protein